MRDITKIIIWRNTYVTSNVFIQIYLSKQHHFGIFLWEKEQTILIISDDFPQFKK